MSLDRRTLRLIARRTLKRHEDDNQPISVVYLTHLKYFLTRHPSETHFTIDLDNGDGSILCGMCGELIPPGNGPPEEEGVDILGSIVNYANHLSSVFHMYHRNQGDQNPLDPTRSLENKVVIDTNRYNGSSVNAPQLSAADDPHNAHLKAKHPLVIDLTDSPPSQFPRDPILTEQASDPIDEDYLLALALHRELNGIDHTMDDYLNPNYGQRVGHSRSSQPLYPSSSTFSNEESITRPWYEVQLEAMMRDFPNDNIDSVFFRKEASGAMRAHCQICLFAVLMFSPGDWSAQNASAMESLDYYIAHLKGPYHIRKLEEQSTHGMSSIRNVASNSSSYHSSPNSDDRWNLPGTYPENAGFGCNETQSDFKSALQMFNSQAGSSRSTDELPSWLNGFLDDTTNGSFLASEPNYGDIYGTDSIHESRDEYDERGIPILHGIRESDKKFKDFMNKALEEFKDAVPVSQALEKLQLQSQMDILDGMRVRLLPHQIIGVSWMLDQEGSEEKRGGILADAMGLGKTVQVIATIMVNRTPRHNGFFSQVHTSQAKGKWKESEHMRCTTLVLVPASLLQQWYEEFTDKTVPGSFKVHIHHGKDKLRTVDEVERYDVIITSHQTLTMDFPKSEEKKKMGRWGGSEDGDDYMLSDFDTPASLRRGVLANVKWLRVVIDEAQNIRNRLTRLSTCVAKLDSRYRWCLTGTPVTNTLTDIYGFLRFCHIEPWNTWKIFNDHVFQGKVQGVNQDLAGRRAQTLLKPYLLRRTKESTIDGKPILQLSLKTVDIIELEFSADERLVYDSVESKQRRIVSKFYTQGTIMKNYSQILIMILRLRQLCGHPFLAMEALEETNPLHENFNLEKEMERAKKIMGVKKFEDIQERFRARIQKRMNVNENEEDLDECPICYEPIVDNRRVTRCGHEYDADCINEVIRAARGEEEATCPMCRAPIERKVIFPGIIFEPKQEEIDAMSQDLQAEPPRKRQKLDELDEDTLDAIKQHNEFVPSTKMQMMLDLLKQWHGECPQDKVIIYSQWTTMLSLVERYLSSNKIQTLRYDGKMDFTARANAVARFKEPTGPSIMLISLKCGGVGLNLTVANRIINLDLAWNYATEAQAYDRVHRLGQTKPVCIQRLIIRNTIEERMIHLQKRKQELSDAALGEGAAGKISRMTAGEIMELFNLHV